ncbi:TRASH domain-containing protein [Nitratidesulfovibrio sp. SRB-5]|uniref:TRASH domain protein n=1 Tax=Nitratidesulfovibrio vulgaris (strain DSM 19637 / Miyazaki F) TaxID=883 RepID=B8DJJ8_NITV9|nr:TRASH domain-containing protein [Nitratidesulfovibrio sp. SRB-5]MBZ2171754.1 transcriptional regulator [Nitratidesulfovibrio sp. SRB-5]RXF78670.1 transcriptional regulator [Desulfovibrio sp. DS-1]
MLKWLLLIAAGYFLYRLVTNEARKKSKDDKKQKEEMVATGEMVRDPICGAYIDANGGVTVRDGDKTYRFCSYECRDTFLKQLESGGREIPAREEKDAE